MTFRSPWQSPWFVRSVGLLRLILRPWPGAEERFITSLADQQNRRVRKHLIRHPGREVLLIMPRCVKKPGCPADVKTSLELCTSCEDCHLGDVARLCHSYGVTALVAFRSHIAFEMARTRRPDVIIASACHDRLIKALRSVPEIPALLAPLAGMEKMCVGAQVDLAWLDSQLQIVSGRAAPIPAKQPVLEGRLGSAAKSS